MIIRASALIAIAMLVAALLSCASGAPADDSAADPSALTVESIDGETLTVADLAAASAPRPTLLVFTTVWCKVCKDEQPEIAAWARAHADAVRTLYVCSGSAVDRVARYAQDHALTIDIVTDRTGAVADAFAVRATPTLLLLDDQGVTLACVRHLVDIDAVIGETGGGDSTDVDPGDGDADDSRDGGDESDDGHEADDGDKAPALIPVVDSGRELGTSYDIVVLVADEHDVPAAEADLAEVREHCHQLEARLSEWREDSEISDVNRRAGYEAVELSDTLRQIIAGSIDVSRATGGAFDITWRPFGNLWREAERDGAPPNDDRTAAVLEAVGYEHIVLDGDTIAFDHPDTQLGIAAVAKGWIIDALFLDLIDRGYEHVLVNIGGDLRATGTDEHGDPRRLLLVDPFDPERVVATLEIGSAAVATSGNYFRYREIEGQRYGHIVDPRTGFPPAFEGSVTVLTRDAAMADALATGLFVMGPEAGLAFARETAGLDVVYVTTDGVQTTLPIDRVAPVDDTSD